MTARSRAQQRLHSRPPPSPTAGHVRSEPESDPNRNELGRLRGLHSVVARLDEPGLAVVQGELDAHTGIPGETGGLLALHQYIPGHDPHPAVAVPRIAEITAVIHGLCQIDA